MKYKNVGLIHAIAICIVAFNVMACSNGDNKVLQADGKESIQSSIAKVSHIAEGIEKTYEQSIQRKCMDNNRVDYSDQVLIEKVDQSVYDEQGRLIAQIYYAKPVIQGDSEAVKKINAYFDNEANAFYDQGTSVTWFSKDAFHQFKDGLELMKERWGNEILAEYPPVMPWIPAFAIWMKILLVLCRFATTCWSIIRGIVMEVPLIYGRVN